MTDPTQEPRTAGRGTTHAEATETHRGNRNWWSTEANTYYAEHGDFLGDAELVWGPEGIRESELHLLGDLTNKRVLEFGSGAAQGSRYIAACGGTAIASDIAEGMLDVAQHLNTKTNNAVPLVQADAIALPFADASFDIAFSAYGATPFIADINAMLHECARVLTNGGLLAYSTTHPVRWAFPDAPDALHASMNYFDRSPYIERSGERIDYAEYHRTIGDHVRALATSGFTLLDIVEPEWPSWNTQTWGGWSPQRGAHIPGTAIFVARK
ncbi:class I SAM-dependent methyltransferase [Dermatophilus congolensis]|uniref:class I SAM-dependent methyltransferase n=1 Tax=Dermatophilus congolensis TaxID=1863 RepID=UPI001AAFE5F0|nr:class I SAM-dependent methyltransferase [Dermatophilus congolensis]MBO3142929.1 class I SAM-dependent methyltransferase [Dermatophilus congolensis]MBO3151920.1 class I SAM-dependent methyltransferase [Dermatophilus congolensis]MBO3161074.1 class I SAM-dependent methyltransferase [Dermatophilus congolensis]MBO3163202.1 class I SAM-dependent methyltransferase [Dermatophilus congolensis]MBO3176759.1 class I SAM-dependent methyltransferase [Dermatophilus congolensis]